MPCYHPLVGIPNGVTEKGKTQYVILKNCDSAFVKETHPDAISIPCGRCVGCRLDKSRAWADRLMLELDYSKKAVFVTLTVDNVHLHNNDPGCIRVTPSGKSTLCVRDLQLFMKRLLEQFPDRKIRRYLIGEYGPRTQRSHYHGIIFGLGLDDFKDKRLYKFGKNNQPLWISDWFAKEVWKLGNCIIEDVCWENCAYCARYCTKKLTGDLGKEFYGDRIPPFSIMSRNPGIAGKFYEKYNFDFDETYLSSPSGSKTIKTPKYFIKKLELDNPELAEYLKGKRKEFIDDKRFIQDCLTDLSYEEELLVKEDVKTKKTKSLVRSALDLEDINDEEVLKTYGLKAY